MKLFSMTLEIQAIQSITSSRQNLEKLEWTPSAYLLSVLDTSFFHYEPCKAAFERILFMMNTRGKLLTFSELLEDLTIPEDYRGALSEGKRKYKATIDKALHLYEVLGDYRKTRILYGLAKEVLDTLKKDAIKVDDLVNVCASKITEANLSSTTSDTLYNMGKDCNSTQLIKEALSSKTDKLYLTGFQDFDSVEGGLPSEGVILLGGTTGGGKSTVRMNLLANMYRLNAISVGTVSLEMNALKETRRLLSFLGKVPLAKFNKNLLTKEDRVNCKKAYRKFEQFGIDHDCKYSFICPTRGLTIDQTFSIIRPYGFKVLALDYASLFEGMNGQDQAKALKGLIRSAKIFSSSAHCLVVILVQVDDSDDHIRYSKGMLEDADNCWVWNYSKPEDRERKKIPVRQIKGRDQSLFGFDLEEDFQIMTVSSSIDSSTSDSDYTDASDPIEVPYVVD